MYTKFQQHLQKELADIEAAGLYKHERIIESPQGAEIMVKGKKCLNFCANNYLGLADNPELIEAAKKGMDARGYGMASVRFICGCQDLHKQLEKKIAEFFGTEDTILYAACFDANGGVFEPLLTEEDAIISDALNHASIIDGVRLCKAQRYRYANADMADLEEQLKAAQKNRFRIIVTDGVFSMDGNVCPLDKIYELANKYDAMVMVDESHSAGVVGKTGRGVTERYNLRGKIEILTGTLGKAFGGAMGGFTTGKKEIIDMLRQRREEPAGRALPPDIRIPDEAVISLRAVARGLRGEREGMEHGANTGARAAVDALLLYRHGAVKSLVIASGDEPAVAAGVDTRHTSSA